MTRGLTRRQLSRCCRVTNTLWCKVRDEPYLTGNAPWVYRLSNGIC